METVEPHQRNFWNITDCKYTKSNQNNGKTQRLGKLKKNIYIGFRAAFKFAYYSGDYISVNT